MDGSGRFVGADLVATDLSQRRINDEVQRRHSGRASGTSVGGPRWCRTRRMTAGWSRDAMRHCCPHTGTGEDIRTRLRRIRSAQRRFGPEGRSAAPDCSSVTSSLGVGGLTTSAN